MVCKLYFNKVLILKRDKKIYFKQKKNLYSNLVAKKYREKKKLLLAEK